MLLPTVAEWEILAVRTQAKEIIQIMEWGLEGCAKVAFGIVEKNLSTQVSGNQVNPALRMRLKINTWIFQTTKLVCF